ncbi:MAG: hypothetical protein CM1200mP41_04350 [Gammaproteobacteria bacterium]|nr:MAG: hypothetical protein CM1200mP41_04350 [Gammaproteobacteria bacterium]
MEPQSVFRCLRRWHHSTVRNRDEIDIEIGKEWVLSLDNAPTPETSMMVMRRLAATGWWPGGQEAPLHSDHLIIGGCGGHLKAVDGAG